MVAPASVPEGARNIESEEWRLELPSPVLGEGLGVRGEPF